MTAPPSEPEPSAATRVIDALVAGGQPVDEGRFSLDVAAAADKLDNYQHADRSAYLVPLVEGARGLDARRITLTTHGEDLSISMEGVELPDPLRFLSNPFGLMRGADLERKDWALGRLGVALHMALGHARVARVAVSYSDLASMLVAEYRGDGSVRLARREPEVTGELRIIIDRPWIERVSLRGAWHAEIEVLRAAIQYSRFALSVDGESLAGHSRKWAYVTRGSGPGYSYEAGLEPHEDPSVLELWSEGLCVETLPGPGLGFRAAIHLTMPRRDLSQMKIVHDETFNTALAAVEHSYHEALERLARHDASWTGADRPSHWPRARVDRLLGRHERERLPEETVRHRIRANRKNIVSALVFGCVFGIITGSLGFALLVGPSLFGGLWFLVLMLVGSGAAGRELANILVTDKRTKIVIQGLWLVLIAVIAGYIGLEIISGIL
ncbi:MAG: hypothetical protein R6X02_32595 [Enhygromyxa sp.]